MALPAKYNTLTTLAELLELLLKAYPSAKNAIGAMTDGVSAEFQAFHYLSVKDHIHSLQISQFGDIYLISRGSTVRGTVAYEKFNVSLFEQDPLQLDERNIAYRYFANKYLDWVTLKIV